MSAVLPSRGNRHRPFLRFTLLTATGLLLGACAPKVLPTGLVSTSGPFDFADDRDLKIRRGPDLTALEEIQKVWEPAVAPSSGTLATPVSFYDPASTRTLIFVILYPSWAAGDALTGEDRVQLVLKLRQDLDLFTRAFYDSPVLIRYFLLPDDPLARKSYPIFIESTVSQVGTGFGPARHLIGYGLGRTSLQVEGRFRVGSPKGPTVAEYAVRASHSGNPLNGLNVKVYSPSYCLKMATEEAAYRLMKRMRDLIPPPPPPPNESDKDKTAKAKT